MDYYTVLGISRGATDMQIKQAFKALALQCMKGLKSNDSVEEFFLTVAEAYEVLTNDNLRAIYDHYGSDGLKAGVPTPNGFSEPYVYHGDCVRTFEEFFGTRNPYADILDIRINPPWVCTLPEGKGMRNKPDPMIRPVYCTIEELYQGCVKKMKIRRQEIISPESHGQTELKEKILDVPIKPGMLEGTEIVFNEEGDEGPANCPADIIFVVKDRPHDLFVREGANLVMTVHVTLLQSLTGTTITVKTPDYRTLRIPIHDIICPTYEKIVKNEGMPFVEDFTKKGDLIMRFKITFPTYLPRASKNLIRKALNVCKMITVPGEAENINLWVLMDKEPELDYEYFTNPANRAEIEENIKSRKNVGDINRILELDAQFRAEKCPAKRETLWQSLVAEAVILPNRTCPTIKEYEGRPKVLKRVETVAYSFVPKMFQELAKELQLIRTKDLKPVTGSRSYFFIGDLADLEHALIKYTVSYLLKKNFKLISVPDIIPVELLERCGMTPNSIQTQVFQLEEAHGQNLVLSGTSEMSLSGMHANSLFNVKDLPICVTAVSRCFRSEVSNISEERGIFRVHQFSKVEMFGMSHPSQSEQLMEHFIEIQEELFSLLGLDYQVVDMPSHELGAPAYRKHDIEAWFPGKEIYGEISSCSNCTDYQSRRLNIKCKDENKLFHVHTLNATACAVPRMIIALFETHQQQNGNIKIPEALRPFMNNKEEIQLTKMTPRLKAKVRESRKGGS